MRLLLQRALLFPLIAVLVACQSNAVKNDAANSGSLVEGEKHPLQVAGAEPASSAPTSGLTSDIVFNLLAGEVAAQRGDFSDAYKYQYQSALLSGDVRSAERATRLALHADKNELALKAARLWVKLDPEDLTARQMVVVLMLRKDKAAPVLSHLKAIVRISDDQGDNGFLNAMAAINRELDRKSTLHLMRQLVAGFPDDPRGYYALTIAELLNKDYPAAEKEARHLVKTHPDWSNGYLVLSRVYVAEGHKDKARETLANAVGRFPDESSLVSAYARLLVDNKELKSAYKQFLRLERLEPEDGNTSYWLGLLALELGDEDAAKGHFLHLISLQSKTETAAYYLGRIEEDKAHPKKAIKWFQQVEHGEFVEESQARIVRLMERAGEIDRARDWLQGMRIQYPDQSVRFYLMEIKLLRDHGTPQQVMALFDQALGAMPDNNDLLYARGLYAASQNRLDILERDMLKVIASNPNHADALNALGYTLADQTNRHQEALDYIQRALAIKPDSPAIMDSMGWVLYRLGRLQEAIGYLRKAFQKLPDDEIAAHLGEVLWVHGERKQARKVWQNVLDKTPKNKYVLEAMRRLKI